MKLIIPMAGRGTRLRPHTHVTPKPLLPVAGKTMVGRIVQTFAEVLPRGLEEAVFILGPDFGDGVREQLTQISEQFGMKAHFGVQDKALGTAHAVAQAGEHLEGEVVVVFADTLFYMDEKPNLDADAVLWVKEVDDPRRFGVVVREEGRVTRFVEKPSEPISHEAIIGIYYIKQGADLRREINYLMENEVTGHGGEYQLTDALDRMLQAGARFETARVSEWLDCGTVPALQETTAVVLEKESSNSDIDGSVVIEPVYLGKGVTITRSVIGPHVSIEEGATITDSVLARSIVFANAQVRGSSLDNSLVGHHAEVSGVNGSLNIGDHSTVGAVDS
ncbi:sugar phosphate nucleotidyltransferase [soil metagenome]